MSVSKNLAWRPRHSVKTRLIVIQAVITTILVSLLAAFLYIPTRQSIATSSNEAYFVLTNNLVATIFNSLSAENYDEIIAAAKRIEGVKGVSYVLVQNDKKQVVYDTDHKYEKKTLNDETTKQIYSKKNVIKVINSRDGENFYEYAAPFLINNVPKAIVRIGVSQKSIDGDFEKLRLLFLRTSALVLILGVIISFIISAKITAPIRRLTESALAIRAGNLNVSPNITTNDEMEQLSREFKRMVEQLKVFYLKEVKEKELAIEDVKKVQEINKQLRILDEKKNEFLSIASHQLRTPLSIILWTTSIIKEKSFKMLDKNEQKMLIETEKNARIMEDLIGELLDMSRMEKGTQRFKLKEVNLVDFAREIVSQFQIMAEQKKIILSIEKGSVPVGKIVTDSHSLRHIIANLIDNAIRYTEDGGKVKVRIDKDDGRNTIRVEDTGIGITKEEQAAIFKQFSRGERAKKISPDGSGLGLFLVKQLVAKLGGQISVESSPGTGSKFIVILPDKVVVEGGEEA